MNILVVGLGSMGKRRIRILKTLFPDIKIVGVDANKERCLFCENEYKIMTCDSLEATLIQQEVKAAFVCTSPLTHADIIRVCLEQHVHVFTEINLNSDGYEKNIKLAKNSNVVLFLSSTPLYREEMKYIVKKTSESRCLLNYSYHVGQYLPDWHPWESFKDYFIGQKSTNGCRELFAIEFPWLLKAFGDVVDIQVMSKKMSNLEIEYDDSYFVLMKHKNGHQGCLAVDVVCREPMRKLEIYGENLFIEWQGTENSLKEKNLQANVLENVKLYDAVDKLDQYSKNIIENPYIEEVKAFFAEIEGEATAQHNFEKDLEVLKLIDRIEASCK